MKRVDLEALRRAIAMARASDRCGPSSSPPPPPCWMGDEKPIDDMPLAGRVAAWELRRNAAR